jgi:poly(glycerol-phosphate) alpha-glucosyltransferase
MSTIQMPAGCYLALSGAIRAGTGGQTRALIMRNRLLTQYADVATTLTTFDADPVYPEVRAGLESRGELVPGMRLLNIFEWYREHDLLDEPTIEDGPVPIPPKLPSMEGFATEDVLHPDGTVYVTRYLHPRQHTEAALDYRRPDGSVFLRVPAGWGGDAHASTPYILLDASGRPIGAWLKKGGWHRHWLQTLAGDADRVFLISDSRFALAHVTPIGDDRFHVLHLMHNVHLTGDRRWDSPIVKDYVPLFNNIRHLDGLVTLTGRQREDVRARFGATDNLFVVPNPVELPDLPSPMPPRKRATFAIVTRLEQQKRLEHAIEAFALVLKQRPEAELHIYGDGKLRLQHQALIDDLGVGDKVVLMGHDPRAKAELLTATAFLMTSRNEGYPLATLESMSYGCPVISYDIKYGPRDQITDGVDGFIVEAGDRQAVADKVIELIDDPELVSRLSAGALRKAEQHDYRAFLNDWREALEAAVANKSRRVARAQANLTVHAIGNRPAGRAKRLGRLRPWSGAFRRSRTIQAVASLHVRGQWPTDALNDAVLTLDALCAETGEVVALPLTARREARVFHLSTSFDLAHVFAEMSGEARSLRLRLRAVLYNWAWETELDRPMSLQPTYEMSFDRAGTMELHRGAAGLDEE